MTNRILTATRRRLVGTREERGAVLVIVGIAMTMLLAATALAFDIGREVDTNRSVQAVADAVALDSANFLDGSAPGVPDPDHATETLYQVVQAAAMQSAARNDFVPGPTATLSMALGTCSSTATVTCVFTPVSSTDLTDPVDAVQITTTSPTKFVFASGAATSTGIATAVKSFSPGSPNGPGGPPPPNGPTGTTGTTLHQPADGPLSEFTIGSSLAAVSTSNSTLLAPTLNALLAPTFGPTFSATLVGYQGLAASQVSVGQILAANPSVGTLSSLLDTPVTAKTFFSRVLTGLQGESGSVSGSSAANLAAAITQLTALQSAMTGTATFTPCRLVTVHGASSCTVSGNADLSAVSNANLDLLTLLTGTAAIENGGHFAATNITGLGALTVTTSVVSPESVPLLGFATTNASRCPTGTPYACPDTQTDQQVNATVTLQTPSLIGTYLSAGLTVTGATSTGTLTTLVCDAAGSSSPNTTAGIGVSSTAVGLSLSKLSLTALGVSTNILGNGSVSGGNPTASSTALTFTGPFNGSSPAAQQTGTSNPAITLSVGGSVVGGGLSGLLTNVTNLNGVLSPVLAALGVDVGAASVSDTNVECGATPYLVN